MHRLTAAIVLGLFLVSGSALAQTGVSDDRVSLPEGPGSLEGVGQNVSIQRSMGSMSHSVPFVLPEGYAGMTPELALSYSSSGGQSVAGMGWSFPTPFIERLTLRGLPTYDLDDEFAVGGAEQLVRIPGTNPPEYRARFEQGFTRWTWHDAGLDGDEGYWVAEHTSGRIEYYGADRFGNVVAEARVGGAAGTFRYHLVEAVNRLGQRVEYEYGRYGNYTLVDRIAYTFPDGINPENEVELFYEAREDLISDCKPGFNEVLGHRLAAVDVFTDGTRIRRYELSYEDYDDAGGFSRLAEVVQIGVEGGGVPDQPAVQLHPGAGRAMRDGHGLRAAVRRRDGDDRSKSALRGRDAHRHQRRCAP